MKSRYSGNDFYCDVALKSETELKKEYENEHVLAFRHTRPRWPVHILVVPKKHIPSFTNFSPADAPVLAEVMDVVRQIAQKVERERGAAKVITNLGTYQDSKHLHFHVVSGEEIKGLSLEDLEVEGDDTESTTDKKSDERRTNGKTLSIAIGGLTLGIALGVGGMAIASPAQNSCVNTNAVPLIAPSTNPTGASPQNSGSPDRRHR